ncbi:MAG: hypothetical protein U0353_28970 [Sandaracinus sp.]
MKSLVSGGLLVAGVGLASVAAGCTCDGGMMTEPDAARPPRVDADVDADIDAAATLDDDAYSMRDDTNSDVGPVVGFDSGPGSALDCRHSHLFGEDFWYLARDHEASTPSFTSVAGNGGNLVGVYSTTDGEGARHLEYFRYVVGAGGADPSVLAGGAGGSLPSIVAAPTEGFWVTYVVGTDIRVARFHNDMSADGASVSVGSDTVTTPPRIAATSTAGYVIWVTGNTIRGRALDGMGMPTGTVATLVTGTTAIQQASLQRVGGSADRLAISWADGGRPHVAQLTGSTLGTAEFVAGDPGIYTSIDMGGQSRGTMTGLPLAGATVYDLNDMGLRDIVFRVIDDTVRPSFPAATVGSSGDYAWSGSVEPFLTGYALAYRALLPGIERPVLRIGYLDREGCRLGAVTDRFVIGLIDSETGAVPQLGVDGGTMLIVWSDERPGEYFDYWASIMTCSERS